MLHTSLRLSAMARSTATVFIGDRPNGWVAWTNADCEAKVYQPLDTTVCTGGFDPGNGHKYYVRNHAPIAPS